MCTDILYENHMKSTGLQYLEECLLQAQAVK
jgi:hypothetical protein